MPLAMIVQNFLLRSDGQGEEAFCPHEGVGIIPLEVSLDAMMRGHT